MRIGSILFLLACNQCAPRCGSLLSSEDRPPLDAELDLGSVCYSGLAGEFQVWDVDQDAGAWVKTGKAIVADLDGDGVLDFLDVGTDGEWLFHHGVGDGTFAAGESRGTSEPYELKRPLAADFDGDGDVDVVTLANSDLVLHVNDGQARFTAQRIESLYGTPPLSAADLEGGGRFSLLVLGDAVEAWTLSADGAAADIRTLIDEGSATLLAAELDGTPGQELVLGDGELELRMLDAPLEPQVPVVTTIGSFEHGEIAAGDRDGDGLDEIAVALAGVTVLGRDASGGWGVRDELMPESEGADFDAVAIADADADGRRDVLALREHTFVGGDFSEIDGCVDSGEFVHASVQVWTADGASGAFDFDDDDPIGSYAGFHDLDLDGRIDVVSAWGIGLGRACD